MYRPPSSSKYDYGPPPVNDTEWHLTFAWWPVKIQGEWYWCCDVMRKRVYTLSGFWPSQWWYRLPTEQDKQHYIDRNK